MDIYSNQAGQVKLSPVSSLGSFCGWLSHTMLNQELSERVRRVNMVLNTFWRSQIQLSKLEFFSCQARAVHRLAQNLDSELNHFFPRCIILIVLLKNRLSRLIICSNSCSLPSTIVSTWVTHIQLKPVVPVPACKKKGNSKRAETTKLGVSLLGVTKRLNQLLNGHWLLVHKGVTLSLNSSSVNQNVGIRHYTSNCTSHMVIDLVHFLHGWRGLKKFRSDFLLTNQHHSVFCQDSNGRTSIANSFHSIFNLVETTFRWEDRGATIIPPRHFETASHQGRKKETPKLYQLKLPSLFILSLWVYSFQRKLNIKTDLKENQVSQEWLSLSPGQTTSESMNTD